MKDSLKIFRALDDETRLKIVEILSEGDHCVCDIVPKVKRCQSTVSIQLSKLEDLGIVESWREGRKVHYKLTNKKVMKILKIVNKEGKKRCKD